MEKQTNPDWVESWTFDAIRTFADAATEGELVAMQESFERQADFLRRNGDDRRAAFWEALAKGIADVAGRSDRRDAEALPRRCVV
jgi:hypothetical protein